MGWKRSGLPKLIMIRTAGSEKSMNPSDSSSPSPPIPDEKLASLSYETIDALEPAGARPVWVYAVAGLYTILLVVFLTFPAWASWAFQPTGSELGFLVICTGTITAGGFTLILIPVRASRRRPITRRSIWIPILGSGLLAGALVAGAGLALGEYLNMNGDTVGWEILFGAVLVWAAWAVIFGLVAFNGRERGVGLWLHRWLIAGSALELLVAVPTHIIVRRRHDCCGGIATGLGICLGVVVMFISFGPSVLLLYYRRRKQIVRD